MRNPTWNHSRCGEEYGSPASSRSTWGLPVALPRNSAFPTWFEWLVDNCPKIKLRIIILIRGWFDLTMNELKNESYSKGWNIFVICSVAKAFPIFWQMIPLKMTSVSTLKKTPCPGSRFLWWSSSTSLSRSPCPGRRSQLWSTVDLPWYLPCTDVFRLILIKIVSWTTEL